MLSLGRGDSTKSSCNGSTMRRKGLAESICGAPRTMCHTVELMAKNDKSSENAQLRNQCFMQFLLLVLHVFLLVGVQPCDDIYRLFCSEPMHVFSSSLVLFLNEYMSTLLEEDIRTAGSIVKNTAVRLKFKPVLKQIFQLANEFLRLVEKSPSG